MYRKSLFYISIILIVFSGCTETSVGGSSSYQKDPIEIITLAKGEILNETDFLDIEYSINDSDVVLNKLVITLKDVNDNLIKEVIIEEEPLSEWVPPMNIDDDLSDGRYILTLSFYSDDELYYSDQREFFKSDANYNIRSITSYPPVLYPGGGGLFYADTECSAEDCWLRWALDGKLIASGMQNEGYQSIRIDAPEHEGVYELTLEVFPFAPDNATDYEYKSTVIKTVPLYVNTSQKAGVNEFGPDDEFYSLFHFRGNMINSGDPELSGLETFTALGRPALSVKNGVLGYYLDYSSGFQSDKMIFPVKDGELQSFSLMFSVIPGDLSGIQSSDGQGGLFYSGIEDGSFYLAMDAQSDGQLSALISAGNEEFRIDSGVSLLSQDEYSSISLAVNPSDDYLVLVWYKDGVPVAEEEFQPVSASALTPWKMLGAADGNWLTRFGGSGGFEGLVDEFGVYYQQDTDGIAIDPGQFRRSMELEYGKFLMYAEGFDGEPEDLLIDEENVTIAGSRMIIEPGGFADFPPISPGYEEIIFTISLSGSSSRAMEVVFHPEGQDDEIVRVDLASDADEAMPVNFSLIFTPETVSVGETGEQDGETGFVGDFGGIVYRLINNDEAISLEIESVLVIRKNINVSKAGSEDIRFTGEAEPEFYSGVNIGS